MPQRSNLLTFDLLNLFFSERILGELHEAEPLLPEQGDGFLQAGRRLAAGLVHVQDDDRPGPGLEQGLPDLLLRARRPRIAEDVVVDHLVAELARHLHGHLVAVRRAGPVELRLAARDGLDLSAVFLDLVDELRHACRPLDAVSLVSVHGAGLVGKAVVFDLEEGVGGELFENGRVGIDPASADKEGGGDLFLPQKFDEHRVDPAAPRAAAGIEGQRDDLLGRVELCLDAGNPLAPLLRGLVFVGGDEPLLRGGCRGLRSGGRGFAAAVQGPEPWAVQGTVHRGGGSSCG